MGLSSVVNGADGTLRTDYSVIADAPANAGARFLAFSPPGGLEWYEQVLNVASEIFFIGVHMFDQWKGGAVTENIRRAQWAYGVATGEAVDRSSTIEMAVRNPPVVGQGSGLTLGVHYELVAMKDCFNLGTLSGNGNMIEATSGSGMCWASARRASIRGWARLRPLRRPRSCVRCRRDRQPAHRRGIGLLAS